jgi:S1-C subfamily serine protease
LGIRYLDTSQGRLLGIKNGILILDAPEGSAAEIAGLRGTVRMSNGNIQLGDIITAIGDDKITSEADLFKAIEKYHVGDRVTLQILRANNIISDNDIVSPAMTVTDYANEQPLRIDVTLAAPIDKAKPVIYYEKIIQ